MRETGWVERASRRIDAWPVGPVAALMLGAATGFFCWAMPYSPAAGRVALIAGPALLAAALTLAIFRWIDVRASAAIVDEGDDEEDWLTRPTRRPEATAAAMAAARQAARPFIIDADADEEPLPERAGGWPLPLVDRPSPSAQPVIPGPVRMVREIEAGDGRVVEPAAADEPELLLDRPLPEAGVAPPVEERPVIPIEELMERLAAHIGRREAADVRPALAMPANEPSGLSDEEALRAALADLQRMAAKRP